MYRKFVVSKLTFCIRGTTDPEAKVEQRIENQATSNTHHLLPLDKPIIHLCLMEQMSTRQDPNYITPFKASKADGTFIL